MNRYHYEYDKNLLQSYDRQASHIHIQITNVYDSSYLPFRLDVFDVFPGHKRYFAQPPAGQEYDDVNEFIGPDGFSTSP